MSQLLDKLNLRPQERRILVVIITVALLALNALFVWPHRKDWVQLKGDLDKASATLKAHQAEVDRVPEYQRRLAKLEGQGLAVLPAEQALQLLLAVQNQASQCNVAITGTRSVPASSLANTNAYFDEQAIVVSMTTAEKDLVAFLLALGAGNSMIRVRDMDLRPDPPQQRLIGSITLVASYQKKTPPAKPSPTSSKPSPQPAGAIKKRP